MSFGLRLAALLGLALACLLAALLALCWLLAAGFGGMFLAGGASAGMHPRGWRIALAFDQLANVVAGGFEDETISSRAWRMAQGGSRKWALLRRAIDAHLRLPPCAVNAIIGVTPLMLPSERSAPAGTRTLPEIGVPPKRVPFLDPRSSTNTPLGVASRRAWIRDNDGSSTTMSAGGARPTVRVSPGRTSTSCTPSRP